MKEERDFAGFVLPFATGTFFTTGSYTSVCQHIPYVGTCLFLMTSLCLAVLMHPKTRAAGSFVLNAVIALSGLSAGAFIGFTSTVMETGRADPSIFKWMEEAGAQLGHAIDSIDFSYTGTNALLKALITGDKGNIPEEITESFRISGASHILALSGFHIGIIYGIISWTLSWLGGHRRISVLRSVIIVALCGLYALGTGAGASIVRAFLFILLGETARLTHRNASTSSILFSAMLIQLFITPESIHSVSFQLSYAAMAGIAFIFPKMKSFWPEEEKGNVSEWRFLKWIWTSASLSISCQLTTGPIAWYYFSSFPHHFLLTNLIAIPLTGIIIPAALITLVLNTFGICPLFMLKLTEGLAGALTSSLAIIATM